MLTVFTALLNFLALSSTLIEMEADGVADRPATFAVERHKDIAYRTGKGADKARHVLDVYVPKGQKGFPVVLFVHGGRWTSGNKNLYGGIGESLARHGIGVVICNYRLSPAVKHPVHVQDVASAFAWTRNNIATYGGKPDRLFVCGHSAGGHLVALLATDAKYLKAEKLSPSDIRGVVPISGVYSIEPPAILKSVFGSDAEVRKDASPLTHARGKHPPCLIAFAETDYPSLGDQAKEFHDALKKAGSPCELLECKDRNHITIITSFRDDADPLNQAVRAFVIEKSK
jgi:acetyl esterase/lipase